jgi:predicted ABC-type transport system involved in lysophospholipase L1 biosynthesis ATPase subunit
MTGGGPLVEIVRVVKAYGAPQPLRIGTLTIHAGDRIALFGLDAAAAETLVHLITGASLPDEGVVRVGGRDTREIATDTEWLASLDRFGIVTARAVLMGALPIAANLALPLTLSIDPMSAETRTAVEALADQVGLSRERLGAAASSLAPAELVKVHLARALALRPELLLLEHPTATIENAASSRTIGQCLADAVAGSSVGWLALTGDGEFWKASNSTRVELTPSTGAVRRERFWSRLVR